MSNEDDQRPKYQIKAKGKGIVIGDYANVVQNYFGDPRLRLYIIILGVLIIGSIAALYFGLRQRQPKTMSGDFRIAVAEFYEQGNSDYEELGREIADGIKRRLDENLSELNPEMVINVWGPEQVGLVAGSSQEERAIEAESLANKIHADLIIYGVVDTSQPTWHVSPEFYVSIENFYEAQEIVGQYELGSPIELPDQFKIVGRKDLGVQMLTRSQVLSNIAIGLAYYAIQDYSEALNVLKRAEDISEWLEDQGKHVLYILLGNAAGKERQIDAAKVYFERAIKLEPDYARAYIGLGSVAYIRALEPFEDSNVPADVDNNLLEESIQNLQKALEANNQPPLADIQTKVHFGLGQAYLAQSFSGSEDRINIAIEHFNAVIQNYNDGKNPRIHELAAESYARLGLIYDLLNDPSQAVKDYEKAAELHLNYDPDRSAHYSERAEKIRSTTPNP